MTLAEQIFYGMFKPSKYKEMIELSRKRFVGYVVVMMLVLGLIGFVVPTAAIISSFGGFEKLFTKTLGEVEYKDGTLTVENHLKTKITQLNLYVDTDQATVSNDSLDKQGAFMAVGNQTIRLSFVTGSKVTDYAVYRMSDYVDGTFTNKELVAMIPYIYGGLALSFLFNCLGYFIKYAFIALLLSFLVNSLNRNLNLHLSFGEVFALCFYAQSFAMMLSNLNLALNMAFPSLLVSIVDIFVTVHMITASVTYMRIGRDL